MHELFGKLPHYKYHTAAAATKSMHFATDKNRI